MRRSQSRRTIVVTGAARGIGRAILERFVAGSDHVIAADILSQPTDLLEENLVTYCTVDLSVPVEVERFAEEVTGGFEYVGVLVNNAAIVLRKPAEEVLEEEWDNLMNLNVRGTFFCCQIVGREMIRANGGKIINVSSNVAHRLQPIRSVYATSKAAINHLTRALAQEWAKYNINVNALAPSTTITDINRKYFIEEHPEALEAHLKLTPKGRVATPEDYVGAAIFLASDEADYVTGQILYVDGGVTL